LNNKIKLPMENLITIDVLPNIILAEGRYEGHIKLTSWQGFQSRQGVYGSQNAEAPSDGVVQLNIDCGEDQKVISNTHIEAVKYLLKNDYQVRDAAIDGLFNTWQELEEIYEDILPKITDVAEFKNHIGLHCVHVINSVKEGVAYVGLELGCSWDDEHGAGVMMHQNRVIDVGGADVSFMEWVTYDDNGTKEEKRNEAEFIRARLEDHEPDTSHIPAEVLAQLTAMEQQATTPVNKRPWRKFW
jgi:hypothetical protein